MSGRKNIKPLEKENMPRRKIDPIYKEHVRSAYYAASSQEERTRIVLHAMKVTKFSYGGLMRTLDLNVRSHAVAEKQSERISYMNSLGKQVYDYALKKSKGARTIRHTVVFRHLQQAEVLPKSVTYRQISEAIRRQNLKNKSGSLFRRFEWKEPLDLVQVDFSRSVYLERIEMGGIPMLRITYPKGANAKKDRVWIGAGIDDCSRTVYARYFFAKGESSQLAQKLVLKIFSQKQTINKSTGEITVHQLLQGIPKRIYTDKGSAFRNVSFRSGMVKLGIQHILGDMASDSQGNKTSAPNKQARGKIERFIRMIKDDFEATLFLKYRPGKTFTLKEINILFTEWLMKINSSYHPERTSLIKWNIFSPITEQALYPDEEAALMFSTSILCKVIRRQVRVATGIWCRVPDEINTGEQIEIITLGNNYYTPIDGKRVLLQPIAKRRDIPEAEKQKPIQTFATDYLEGIPLRSALNEEIEKRTRQMETIGTLSEKNASAIEEFLSERRMIKEVRLFAQSIIARSKETGITSVSEEGMIIGAEKK